MQKHGKLLAKLFTALVTLALLVIPVASQAARPGKTYLLEARRNVGSLSRVVAALEVSGDYKTTEEDKLKRIKMNLLANVTYDERLLELPAAANGPIRSVRFYDKAAVQLKLDNDEIKPTLSDQRRLIGVNIEGPAVTLFSPAGPLTRDELELVEMHGASLSLLANHLLPDKPVAVGETWEHPAEQMAALLDLDAAAKCDVKSVLTKVADGVAEIELSGRVEGAVGGVATNIEVKARYHFNIEAGRFTWFGLLVSENRAIGHVEYGLEAISRLQMKIAPISESPRLGDASLAGLSLKPTEQSTELAYESIVGGWKFVHDRRWEIYSDDEKLAILRLIDRGELVAQCNIHTLQNAAEESQITLAEFQDDIKHALGDNFGEFVRASQSASEAGYRKYRVVVSGEAEGLSIQWIYYLVADEHGRQVVFAFTVEGSLIERFGEADQRLLSTLRLTDQKVAAKPTTAK